MFSDFFSPIIFERKIIFLEVFGFSNGPLRILMAEVCHLLSVTQNQSNIGYRGKLDNQTIFCSVIEPNWLASITQCFVRLSRQFVWLSKPKTKP